MKKELRFQEVGPDKLRVMIDPESLGFETTDDCEYHKIIIGQDRAVKAVKMGLEIESPGYNIYVAGLSGTGRTSIIKTLLKQLDLKKRVPDDICYVNNFKDPDMPHVVTLPAGLGRKFQKDMDEIITYLRKQILHLFESEEFKKVSEEIVNSFMARQKELIKEFNEKIQKENFQLVQYQVGPYTKQDIVPVYEEKPVTIDQLENLVEQDKFSHEDLVRVKARLSEFRLELDGILKQIRQLEKEVRQKMSALEYRTGLPVVSGVISDIRSRYENHNEKIKNYLDNVQEHVLSNLKAFQEKEEDQQQIQQLGPAASTSLAKKFIEYKVNVLVEHSQADEIPVIIETAPTYKNLFGTIEREVDRSGFWRTDFTRIKAGSLLRANGGYIVFNALEALLEPGVWHFMKRTLKNRLLIMQPYDPFSIGTTALKPEPIPLDVKVVIIGDNYLYHLLYNYEEDFKKIFKTKAQFDTVMPNVDEHVHHYVCFIKRIIDDEQLLPFHKSAVASVIEFGILLAGRQNKLSTRFSDIADLIREGSYWAKEAGAELVTVQHVDKAYREKVARINLIEQKIHEMIEDGTIMIDAEGEAVGQVNGLSVYDMGDYAFGKPSKITAETSVGKSGVINIEREAKLSGRTHDKGVLILEGYFRRKYAQDKPLTMSASICFEQSYGEVDGDSASSTEIYAILSSLSNLSIRQDLAVTGSVNQKGEIQPIGGVNQKIEGFYDVCKAKGLTGKQGVIIPTLNIDDLMLRKDIVQAVADGMFHVYPVRTIDEGIELLTGAKMGVMGSDGTYPPDTVNFLANEKLLSIAKGLQDFEESTKKSENEKTE